MSINKITQSEETEKGMAIDGLDCYWCPRPLFAEKARYPESFPWSAWEFVVRDLGTA